MHLIADAKCDVRCRWVFGDTFVEIVRLWPEDPRKRFVVKFEGRGRARLWRRLPRVTLPSLARDLQPELRPVRVLGAR